MWNSAANNKKKEALAEVEARRGPEHRKRYQTMSTSQDSDRPMVDTSSEPAYPAEMPEWAVDVEAWSDGHPDDSWTFELTGKHATVGGDVIPRLEVWVSRQDVYKDGILTLGQMEFTIWCERDEKVIDLPLFYAGCLRNNMIAEAMAGVSATDAALSYSALVDEVA